MQIHELNTYTGDLDDAYMVVDNGSDTGKKKVEDITAPLDARIDNIIAGGDAPSEAEIIDARLGANGVTYPSLGDAIRSQIEQVEDNSIDIENNIKPLLERVISPNRYNKDGNIITGYYLGADGSLVASASWGVSDYCYVKGFSQIYGSERISSTPNARNDMTLFFLCTYDEDKQFIEQIGGMPTNPVSLDSDVAYVRFCYNPNDATKVDRAVTETDGRLFYSIFYDSIQPAEDIRKAGEDSFDFNEVNLTLTSSKYLPVTGQIADISSPDYKISDLVSVTPNGKVMLTTFMNWGNSLYNFYDSSQNYIECKPAGSGSPGTVLQNEIIDVPYNAYYIRVACITSAISSIPAPVLFVGVPQPAYPSGIWSNKKWTCVGDSLTEYNTRTIEHYFDYIRSATGINIFNMGVSGTGYAKGGSDNFMNKISNVPIDSDVVTIFGSGNDSSAGLPLGTATDSGTTTLGGCINATIDNLYAIMPVVQLGIVTPSPWANNMPSDNGWMESYANLIVEICKRRSIPCLDLYHCSNLNPNSADVRTLAYSRDDGNGVHPNELGHKIIAPRFKAFLDSLII